MLKHWLTCGLALIGYSTQLLAQPAAVGGELLVWRKTTLTTKQNNWEALAPDGSLYLLRVPLGEEEATLAQLRRDPTVLSAQRNHFLQWRNRPNDPLYSTRQEHLERMQAETAWAMNGLNGCNALGDSLVVAVIDAGGDWQHEDLTDNIWINRREIPDNGLDDDQNGYIDDYRGWRCDTDNDQHERNSSHGSSVMGIIGARGDNGKGIAGIHWRTRLMMLSMPANAPITEANALECYAYILRQRQRYNASNGQEGAFIVASNASFGIDYAQGSDYPIWCAMYDSLGQAGVLNVCATANLPINVDVSGDMPSTCTSEFLIAVTECLSNDWINSRAAYGRTHIDLAAQGSVYTTRPNNSYNAFSGTSGAAPHVAGAIALLYGLPNEEWARQQREQPAQAALLAKSAILASVARNENLRRYTLSGGRLNLGGAAQELQAYTSPPSEGKALLRVWRSDDNAAWQARLALANTEPYEILVYNALGQVVFVDKVQVAQASTIIYTLDGIEAPQKGVYWLQLRQKKFSQTEKISY